jgi:dihydrofolate reductase
MGRIVVTEFLSLDGVMEAPGGGEDFEYAGWSFEVERGEEGDRFKFEETMSSEALLLGRVTYEGFAAAWPERSGEFADKYNSMPKHVASTTLTGPLEWSNSTLIEGDVPGAVTDLKQGDGGEIQVHGSCTLVHALIEHGLVDEYRLMVFPVMLGSGKRLFPEREAKTVLKLADTRTFDSGVQVHSYEPATEEGG